MDIEIHFLRHAVAVAEYMHFGNAAKSLHLSQPALSRSIFKLEQNLGQPIFIRGTRAVIPTDFGRIFLERAKLLLADVSDFSSEMIDAGNETNDELIIGCGPYPAETIVVAAAVNFSKQYPKVKLTIKVDSIETMLPALFSGAGIECLIAELSTVNLLPGLDTTHMGSHALVFIARAGHPLSNTKPSIQQILQYPFIAPSRIPPRLYGPLHAIWKKIPLLTRPAFPALVCTSMSVAKQILLRTDAIIAMQLSATSTELESGEFITLSTEPWLHLNYGLIKREGIPLSSHAMEFKNMLIRAEKDVSKQEKQLINKYLGK